MITLLTVLGIFFGIVIMAILSVAILTFGKLIAKTEDKQDRIGKRTGTTDAPDRHMKYFVISFATIFLMGAVLVITQEYIRWVIIGGVAMMSAILFAGTVLWWSMGSYNQMKKNERELHGSLVA